MLYFSVLWMLKYDNLAGLLTMSIVILVSCLVSALGIVALVVVVVDTYQLTQSLESHRRDNRSHYSSERERAAELSEQVSTPANWCTPSPNCEKQLLRSFGGFA